MDRIISLLVVLNGAGYDYTINIEVPVTGSEDEEVIITVTSSSFSPDQKWYGRSENSIEDAMKALESGIVLDLKNKADRMRAGVAEIEKILGKEA